MFILEGRNTEMGFSRNFLEGMEDGRGDWRFMGCG